MPFILFLLFIGLELYLLVEIGARIGAFNMVLWVFGSAALGIAAVRAQGRDSMRRVQEDLRVGKEPQEAILQQLLIFLGGVLLILPGVITDAIGLLLLFPPTRALCIGLTRHWLASRSVRQGGYSRVIFFGGRGPVGGDRGNDWGNGPDHSDSGGDAGRARQVTIIDCTSADNGTENSAAAGEKTGSHAECRSSAAETVLDVDAEKKGSSHPSAAVSGDSSGSAVSGGDALGGGASGRSGKDA